MAKTYYKYKERGGIVDYAAISKDFSTGISGIIGDIEQGADELTEDILKAQEGVKADVEKEIRAKEAEKARARTEAAARAAKVAAASKTDFNPEMSKEKEANDKFIQAAIQAQNKALDFKRQRDSQQISDSEYLQKMGALEKTFTIMKQASVAVNDMANRTYSGLEDGTVDPVQQLALKEVLSYNFTDPNIRFEIGEDGYGVVYRVDKEGNVVENTRRPVDFIKNLAIQDFKSYDVNEETSELVGMIGKTIEAYRGRGMTNEDLLKKQGIMPSIYGGPDITPMYLIDEYAEGLDDNQLASVMTNVLGSKYKPTFNPEEHVKVDDEGNFYVDEMKILYTDSDPALGLNNRVAQLTESQRSKAREYVKSLILTQFNVKPTPTTSTSATERKAAEDRDKNIKAAKLDITYLRKIFEAKTPEEVSQVLARYSNQLIDLIPETERTGSEFIRAEAVGTGDNRTINVVFKDKYGTIKSRPAGVEIPDNFQDFVDSGGVLITGNDNLRTLREEAMAEISDPSSLVRGDKGGVYEITVLEEQLPSIDTDATLSDAMGAVESELDWNSYFNMGTAYSDMSTAADDMFKKMDFKDYNITRNGDILTISIPEYGSLDFNMNKSAHGGEHDNRRGAFKRYMENIYTALTTGKKVGGTTEPPKPDSTESIIENEGTSR